MASTRYVALLRGINVGGKNKVPMAELRAAFEDDGFHDVGTYIQSGNVLFTTDAPKADLEDRIEALVEQRFGFPVVVVVRSHRQLRDVVTKAPEGFGQTPDLHHSDVIFLKSPLTARKALGTFEPRDGVDRAWEGTGVLYVQRLSAKLSSSRLSKIVSTPEYQLMTIRSWSTTTKILDLLDERAGR